MACWLVAFVTGHSIEETLEYPVSVFWRLVNQGINKSNMTGGGKWELEEPEEKKGNLVKQVKMKIDELRQKGEWPEKTK